MTGAQRGFLLLCSHLGDPQRPVLTVARFRALAALARGMERPTQERDMTPRDLVSLGIGREEGEKICFLLSQEELLDAYLRRAARLGCVPITRAHEAYPARVRAALGDDAPACLWASGDLKILKNPSVSLVGSRDLEAENELFAREAGRQAALQGFLLVSGNARGTDRLGQQAALEAGGNVISVVADRLDRHSPRQGVLWLSEDSYDLDFSAARAHSRNRVIHSFSPMTLVSACRAGKGGTWAGATQNLSHNWSRLFVFADGSEGFRALLERGAFGIEQAQLQDLPALLGARQLSMIQNWEETP